MLDQGVGGGPSEWPLRHSATSARIPFPSEIWSTVVQLRRRYAGRVKGRIDLFQAELHDGHQNPEERSFFEQRLLCASASASSSKST